MAGGPHALPTEGCEEGQAMDESPIHCFFGADRTAQNRPLFERQNRCSLFSVLCYVRYFVRE